MHNTEGYKRFSLSLSHTLYLAAQVMLILGGFPQIPAQRGTFFGGASLSPPKNDQHPKQESED